MNLIIFHWLNDLAGRLDGIDDIMEFFAQDLVWILIGVVACLWLSGNIHNQKLAFHAVLSATIALLLGGWVISPLVNHPRPFVGHAVHLLVAHAPDPSFPSDHATLAFALAFGILVGKRKTGSFMLLLAILTGIARVYVGVHYPADIAGAIVLSACTTILISKLQRQLQPIDLFLIRLYRGITAKVPFLPRT
ncbi:undecaprenyl-diphosphatase [Gorillibacterium massiliense]|uniref:undecaprenyl-diphosphatase n=1 Tax=Gorillibacterium massiliense TaxID=1280390 RepID=UPI0005926E3A|nr:undecaprenyl-diphosphatase [Gorillibacterium massiliense]